MATSLYLDSESDSYINSDDAISYTEYETDDIISEDESEYNNKSENLFSDYTVSDTESETDEDATDSDDDDLIEDVQLFQGHPFSRAHFNTSK